jgi:hypothetical protein
MDSCGKFEGLFEGVGERKESADAAGERGDAQAMSGFLLSEKSFETAVHPNAPRKLLIGRTTLEL